MRVKGLVANLVACLSCSLVSCVAVAQIAQRDMQSYLDPNPPAAARAHRIARAGYASVFPQAIWMAATWDPAIAHQMGEIIDIEGRAKFNHVRGRYCRGGHCASANITPALERLCCFA
jgi:hypothetical protein